MERDGWRKKKRRKNKREKKKLGQRKMKEAVSCLQMKIGEPTLRGEARKGGGKNNAIKRGRALKKRTREKLQDVSSVQTQHLLARGRRRRGQWFARPVSI